MKTLWTRDQNDNWAICGLKGITLRPKPGYDADYFQFESQIELLTDRPLLSNRFGWMTTFGPTDFLLKQSVLPVVVWVEGEPFIRCIGTAFVISCTGYLITACHVLLDPYEEKYAGKAARTENSITFPVGMRFGVLVPINPASGSNGSLFFPFLDCRYWGRWRESPFPFEELPFDMFTDVAICKIALLPDGAAHQPLTISPNLFVRGERAIALGYAEMDDIPVERRNGAIVVPEFQRDLYVSVGLVQDIFPDNHNKREVMAPGPCFAFLAKVPGQMSGGPILGADGIVVRGVVSRSFSGSKHAYGAMIAAALDLPLEENKTLRALRESGNEGIPKALGRGL
ncbi:MAG TPA: trypsin-like peptidase domain-containing protein [Terriglobales bacterium]|nr:trypsin-like peptidase domain-containing protein [Terriglobales bacterium]